MSLQWMIYLVAGGDSYTEFNIQRKLSRLLDGGRGRFSQLAVIDWQALDLD